MEKQILIHINEYHECHFFAVCITTKKEMSSPGIRQGLNSVRHDPSHSTRSSIRRPRIGSEINLTSHAKLQDDRASNRSVLFLFWTSQFRLHVHPPEPCRILAMRLRDSQMKISLVLNPPPVPRVEARGKSQLAIPYAISLKEQKNFSCPFPLNP